MKNFKFKDLLRTSYIWLVLAVIYIPLVIIVLLSFTTPSVKGNVTSAFNWNDGSNYLLLNDEQFKNALLNTVIISVIVVPISVIIAVITCFGIWYARTFYKKATMFTSQTNIMIPDIITGVSLSLLFASTFIPLGFSFGFTTIILSHISYCTPYAIVIIYPRMVKMNKNLLLASYDLGYSKLTTFFKVTLPYIIPSIISSIIIVFAMSFDDFIITKLVGGKVNTISTELYSMAKGIKMWAIVFGSLMILAMIGIVVAVALIKLIKDNKLKKANINEKMKIWNKQD